MDDIDVNTAIIDDISLEKIKLRSNNTGLRWSHTHRSYRLRSNGTSISNISPKDNYPALLDRVLVVGTDVDKYEFEIFGNTECYIGLLGEDSLDSNDVLELGALLKVRTTPTESILMYVKKSTMELHFSNGESMYKNINHLTGRTVHPSIVTEVKCSLTASVTSIEDLCIYIKRGTVWFDTTKGINKKQDIIIKTNDSGVEFDGPLIAYNIGGSVSTTTTEVTEEDNLYYTDTRVSANPTVVSNTIHTTVSDIHRTVDQDLNTTDNVSFNNLTVSGNLVVNGDTSRFNGVDTKTKDATWHVASNNPSDTLDGAFFMEYNDGSKKYAGLVRDATDKQFYLVKDLTTLPESSTYSNTADINVGTLNSTQMSCMDILFNKISINLQTPANNNIAGVPGTITRDNDYIYVCISPNEWKRTNISSWS